MFQRTRRPLTQDERALLENLRDRVTLPRFEPTASLMTFCAVLAAAFFPGLHWKGRALAVGGAVVCALAALPFDLARRRRAHQTVRERHAAQWEPLLAIGTADVLTARATAALRLDDDEGGKCWFLQVSPSEIVCLWDWHTEPMEEVELTSLSGPAPYPLSSRWSGAKLTPLAPKRRFKRVERKPEQGEVLAGRLEELEELLRRDFMPPRTPAEQKTDARSVEAAEALSKAAVPLGFYKYLERIDVGDARREIRAGIGAWFTAAERAFCWDDEALAEGGVADLLDDLRPVLKREGVEYGPIEQTYDSDRGYSITLGSQRLTLWAGDKEGQQAWDLTTIRTVAWVNQQLAAVGSPERLYLQRRGECLLMLLTPELHALIAHSGAFPQDTLPEPLPSGG